MNWQAELEAALDAAAIASALILRDYARLAPDSSAAADVTTQTDRASQDAILQELSARFPNDGFRAEETTPALAGLASSGERLWVIDPIDGTRGFVGKVGEFSVMIALVVGGEAVVGVVAEPAHDRVTYASQGSGCRQRTGRRSPEVVCVSGTAALKAAALIQSHSKPGRPAPEVLALAPARVIETYSAGVKLARVADGSADVYVCTYAALNDWDLAAGHVLVAEAGGRVTRLDGSAITYGNSSPKQVGGVLATNGKLHGAAAAALAGL